MNVSYPCPKCDGSGVIPAFRGIANGVCFTCAGAGSVSRKPHVKKVSPLTPYQARLLTLVQEGDMSTLDYRALAALRDFAHGPLPQCPTLRAIWFDRGEGYFQAAQAERADVYFGALDKNYYQ